MTDKPYINWYSYSDHALAAQIGAFVKHHRLQQNKTQQALAHAAGISRSTISLLERGETVTVSTLIQTLRVLDQLHVMDAFRVTTLISPLALARTERTARKRARSKKNEPKSEDRNEQTDESNW
jgi:transcriptional regulator with XRE-family HTH domain